MFAENRHPGAGRGRSAPPPIFVSKNPPNGGFLVKKIECLAVALVVNKNAKFAISGAGGQNSKEF